MATYHFQLAYSVSPTGDDKSAQARELLRKGFEGWKTVKNIDTTLVGKISFTCAEDENERYKAKQVIKDKITELFESNDVLKHSRTHFSLMVDGLGKHITFYV
ncbi:hypothetical protein [Vibrio rotiferianus]|uniref:hypothetical protein n=1 Tax=Vibrio rotiferianus TaxID=190895 RepID=UPI0005EF0399|nr:hypothetical protein [Vibrio rotiferianus]